MAIRSLAASHDWTVADLHALPDDGNRYEILDGVLCVTPSPRYVHQRAVVTLFELLQPYARALDYTVMPLSGDLQYSDRTLVVPDAFVYRDPPDARVRDWSGVHPVQLVVEVLSRSTRIRDRTVKRALYQLQGIPEYWIIDTDARVIERWRPDSTAAECLVQSLSWQPVSFWAPLEIDVAAYFAAVLDA
jgi:Uma2 family endonuclease